MLLTPATLKSFLLAFTKLQHNEFWPLWARLPVDLKRLKANCEQGERGKKKQKNRDIKSIFQCQ